MILSELLPLLDRPKRSGKEWKAICPAHADTDPSLSIQEGDKGILVYCWAGCSLDDITGALGVKTSDLFYDSEMAGFYKSICYEKPKSKEIIIPPIGEVVIKGLVVKMTDQAYRWLYKYRGVSKGVTVKYELGFWEGNGQKRFSIPIRDNEGKAVNVRLWLPPTGLYLDPKKRKEAGKMKSWPDGIEGRGKARLWPLDQLKEPSIILCEGELDVLALISHGFSAITATGGADTWLEEWSSYFTGKDVLVCGDNDDPGSKGALKRAESLSKAGAKVKIFEWPGNLPKGWDVTDEIIMKKMESVT
jgi:putative DNA primase/helicase